MDSKTFIIGAICGAAIYAMIDLALSPEPLTSNGDSSIHASQSADVSQELEQIGLAPNSIDSSPAQSKFPQIADPGSLVGSDYPEPKLSAPGQSNQFKQGDSSAEDNRRQTDADTEPKDTSYYLDKRREELMAEPRDDSWAYYMEQAITQFLSSHSSMSEFDISYIECRTTTCQIQVVGFDQSTGPTWQRVMYDFGQQYPNQFYESGWSGFDLNGSAVFVQKLKRYPPTP